MKFLGLSRSLFILTVLILFASLSTGEGISQQKQLGKNFDEISKLALKEGKIRFASSLSPKEALIVAGGFVKKYPGIKFEAVRIRGTATAERILTAAMAGVAEYDIADIISELKTRFIEAGVLYGPLKWREYFPDVDKIHVSPDGYFMGAAFSTHVIAYNSSLVPPDRIPKRWEDCTDPYWKGKFVVYTRPRVLAGLSRIWGEAKTLRYAKALKDNEPAWNNDMTTALTQVAAGEYPMMCGSFYQSIISIMSRDPSTKLSIAVPEVLFTDVTETFGVIKGAQNPNAGILLAGWLASPEGQAGYAKVGRGFPLAKGTEKWERVTKAGAQVHFGGWELTNVAPDISEKVLKVWGFLNK